MMEFKTTVQLAHDTPLPPDGSDWMLVSVCVHVVTHGGPVPRAFMYWQRPVKDRGILLAEGTDDG